MRRKSLEFLFKRADFQASVCAALLIAVALISSFIVNFFVYHVALTDRLGRYSKDLSTNINLIFLQSADHPSSDSYLQSTANDIEKHLTHISESIKLVKTTLYLTNNAGVEEFLDVNNNDPNYSKLDSTSFVKDNNFNKNVLRALSGEVVIYNTSSSFYGNKKIVCFPISYNNLIPGVAFCEFDVTESADRFMTSAFCTLALMVFLILLAIILCHFLFRRISNPNYKDLANSDSLTQIKNRNSYDFDIKNIEKSEKVEGVGLLAMDLNNLKMVNDLLGHSVGDQYIRNAAKALRNSVEFDETPYRTGGDEFVVVFRNAEISYIENYIERVNENFKKTQGSWNISTSLSMGFAIFDPECDKDLTSTFRRADYQMYKMKSNMKSSNL